MLPIISGRQGDLIKIEVTINLSGSMLEAEESILRGVNAVGTVATGEALKRFDADGDPIMVGGAKWYSKGKVQKIYHTPYGVVSTERHVYQPAEGGKTFCPMDAGATLGDDDAEPAQQRHQTRHRRLPLMILGEHEAAQLWPEVTIDAGRQRRRHHAAIRRLPAFAAEIHHMRMDHKILHHEARVAFEA